MSTINLDRKESFLNAKDLPTLCKLFLEDRKQRVAPLTIKDYTNALNYLLAWWNEVGPAQGWILRKADFIAFLNWMQVRPSRQGTGLGAATIDTTFKRIKQMFGWAHDNDYLDRDYGIWLPNVEVHPMPRNLPAPVELNRLFRVASDSQEAARNKAILALLIGCGLRRAECTDLDIGDVLWNKDNLGGRLMIREGKGGKNRVVIFDEKTGAHLKLYLQVHRIKQGPLFRGRNGRLGPKGLYVMVKSLVEKAGLSDKIQGPHDLRRLFATEWLRKNRSEGSAQLAAIQMGHTDPKMTVLYSKPTIDDVEKNFTSPMKAVDE